MRLPTLAAIAIGAFVLLGVQQVLAQERMHPTAPGTPGDPVWQGILRLPDGRTFVTDGGLVIDAAIARPASLPGREFPPKLLQSFFGAPHEHEYGFEDFHAAATGKTYTTPEGVGLNATYVDFLRRVLPRSARFRLGGATGPIVVTVDGNAVGAFMPVAQ